MSLTLLAPGEGMEIIGRVCEDLDGDGRCRDDEPGISGLAVWSEDGISVAATDDFGRFALRVREGYLRVLAPQGYYGGGKVLARPNTEVAMMRLVKRAAGASVAPASALQSLAGLTPLYALLVGLIGAVLVGNLRLSGTLGALRRQQRQAADWAQQADAYRQRQIVEERLNQLGPSGLAAQLISDALRESLTAELGLVGLSPSPAPHLIFETRDRTRRFVLTVNPGALKRARRVGRLSAQVALAEGGALCNAEAQVLWERTAAQVALAERPVTPRSADWYLVIDRVGNRAR